MPDREKVIKGLECCISEQACKRCPYSQSENGHLCSFNCIHDALALLKKQEGIIKTLEDKNTKLMLLINEYLKKEREAEAVVRCKDCKHSCGRGRGMYCQFIECEKTGAFHKEDWFCPDGERRTDDD